MEAEPAAVGKGTMQTREFIHALDDAKIAEAIGAAEKTTSGEIRVFVTEKSVDDAVLAGEKAFLRMGMHKTELRNGVLIFFAPKSQKYAVIGDEGVHKKCGQNFWNHIAEEMTPLLKAHRYTDAILTAVREIGEVLAQHFPRKAGDINELPNKVERDHPPPK